MFFSVYLNNYHIHCSSLINGTHEFFLMWYHLQPLSLFNLNVDANLLHFLYNFPI
jgi:hypothetical protein